jgi:putative Holliday junction resolvase
MSKRIVGIDYGQARIGVALSDPSQIIASPLTTIQNKKKLEEVVKEFLSVLKDYSIEEIVIGMPFQLDGKIGTSAQEVLRFVEALKEQTTLPIKTWDERLTTQQTERVMKAGNVSRKKRMKVIDSACATLILQNYLDEKSMRFRE